MTEPDIQVEDEQGRDPATLLGEEVEDDIGADEVLEDLGDE